MSKSLRFGIASFISGFLDAKGIAVLIIFGSKPKFRAISEMACCEVVLVSQHILFSNVVKHSKALFRTSSPSWFPKKSIVRQMVGTNRSRIFSIAGVWFWANIFLSPRYNYSVDEYQQFSFC